MSSQTTTSSSRRPLAHLSDAELLAELHEHEQRRAARQAADEQRADELAERNIGAERTAAARADWARLGPMPDALELAGPIITALRGVLDVFQDRGQFLAWPVGNGEMHAEASELLGTADTLASVLRTWVASVAIPDDDGTAQAVDVLVRMLCSVQPVEHALYAEHHGFEAIAGRRSSHR